jgi:hypothetical protein
MVNWTDINEPMCVPYITHIRDPEYALVYEEGFGDRGRGLRSGRIGLNVQDSIIRSLIQLRGKRKIPEIYPGLLRLITGKGNVGNQRTLAVWT